MKKLYGIIIIAFLLIVVSVSGTRAELIKGNFSDIITTGPWIDTRAYANLAQADAAAVATDKPLLIAQDLTLSANTTLSAKQIIFLQGALITTTGYTLTLSGSLSAGPYQIFTGTGSVLGLTDINAKWFGATGDGVTDDTTALQAAFTAWASYTTLTIPKGTYSVTSAITRSSLTCASLVFEGGAVIAPSGCGGIKLSAFDKYTVRDVWISSSDATVDWATDTSGLQFDECSNGDVSILYIGGFQKGLHLSADNAGVTYNTIHTGANSNNKYGIYLDMSGTGFINTNDFYLGKTGLTTAIYNDAAYTGNYGLYMSDTNSYGFNGNKFFGGTFEKLRNGMYVSGSGHLFASQYFELIDDYWIEGVAITRSVFIAGRWYNSTGSIEGYDSSKISLGNGSRNNVWIGKDNDTEMSLLMESQYGGIGFLDIYGRNVIHQLVSYRLTNSLIFTDAAAKTQYFNKQYEGTAAPTTGSYRKGAVVWNSDPDAGEAAGWMCAGSGTMGKLSGVTATGTNTATSVVVNTTTGLHVGAYITIAGVTAAKTVMGIIGTTVHLSSAIDADVTDAAVAYNNATWVTMANLP